ncbi:hypothetical protein AB833_03595 [Chromatiales bacterium (ex Bugula neritina AB1)]|nr:hypothetical protein AB833_03595 [Chromatiales bacterium (ex Bugula neritina AB1)]
MKSKIAVLLKYSLVLAVTGFHNALPAHEFWIDPVDYELSPDALIVADIKSGELFDGQTYPYMPERIVHATLHTPDGSTPVSGEAGTYPAINVAASGNGLQILTYQSTPSYHQYADFGDFQKFLAEESLQWVEDRHEARGLDKQFTEAYTRYAKSLVKSGAGKGADYLTGMNYELVAKHNPYRCSGLQTVSVQLFDHQQTAADMQVSVFHAPANGGEVTLTRYFTDANGLIEVPALAGEFLLGAVFMVEGSSADIAWHSHWASLTYKVL